LALSHINLSLVSRKPFGIRAGCVTVGLKIWADL